MNKKRSPEELAKLVDQIEPEVKDFILRPSEVDKLPTGFFNKPKKTYTPPHKKRRRRD